MCIRDRLETDPKSYFVERHSVERFVDAIQDENPIYIDENFAKKQKGRKKFSKFFIDL